MPYPTSGWDELVRVHPHAHILQTSTWGRFKEAFGWQAETIRVRSQGALVLFHPLPLGMTLAYVPRGPLANWDNAGEVRELLAALDAACRARRAICLKWEPDLPNSPGCADWLTALGFQPSPQTVQPRRSMVVDLGGNEVEILARMKQKTRYNISLAAKKEVTARAAQSVVDVDTFNRLMTLTGVRDHFGVHTRAYYRRAYELFRPLGQCELFLAEYQGEALAGVMAFALGRRSWYFYGASSDHERNRMAPYLAQWAAMRWARSCGALTYDLWGVPDEDEATLEAEFETRHDGLWGVYRFKRGFGGQLVRTVGAWDRVYNRVMYRAYLAYLKMREVSLG